MKKSLVINLYFIIATSFYGCVGDSPVITPTPFPTAFDQSVPVGDDSLPLFCRGTGDITILLENGIGGSSWSPVDLNRFTRFGRACTYLRAGHLKKPDRPLTAEDHARNLHELLETAGVPGPYLLVGHSIAGLVMVVFVGDFPQEIVGMVCVDCHAPDEVARILAKLGPAGADEPLDVTVFRRQAAGEIDWMAEPPYFDWLTGEKEAQKVTSLGNIPLVVLVAEGDLPQQPTQWDKLGWEAHLEGSQALSQLSTSGRLELVKGVDHDGIVHSTMVEKAVQTVLQK